MVSVSFGNKKVYDGTSLSIDETRGKLFITTSYKASENQYLAIIMYDNTVNKFMLVKVNIKNGGSEILRNYEPLRAPQIAHDILIGVYEHSNEINSVKPGDTLLSFTKRNNMTLLEKLVFFILPHSKQNMDGKDKRIKSGSLSDAEQKYCRCLLDVVAKNPEECHKKQWRQKGCYNPYAVCRKSVHTSTKCGTHYNFDEMTKEDLEAYARLKEIEVPHSYNKEQLLNKIKSTKSPILSKE